MLAAIYGLQAMIFIFRMRWDMIAWMVCEYPIFPRQRALLTDWVAKFIYVPFPYSRSCCRCTLSGKWTISVGVLPGWVSRFGFVNLELELTAFFVVVGDKGKKIVIHVSL